MYYIILYVAIYTSLHKGKWLSLLNENFQAQLISNNFLKCLQTRFMKGFIKTNSKIQLFICIYELIWDISSPATSKINSCYFISPSLWFCVSHPGLEMAWVVRPPETVKTGEAFNVTYSVTARDSFYQWAVQNSIFTNRWMLLMCWVTTGYAGIGL